MVQNAIVKKIIKEGVVEVSLLRQLECGLHCDGACAGCSQQMHDSRSRTPKNTTVWTIYFVRSFICFAP